MFFKEVIIMLTEYCIINNKLIEDKNGFPKVMVFTNPTEEEKRQIIEVYNIDEHTLNSSLDPNELSRLDFEDEYTTLIFKSPKNYSGKDVLFFKASTLGVFQFENTLIVVTSDEFFTFDKKLFAKITCFQDVILKLLYQAIYHFMEHLKVINMISDELENKINKSMENRYLLNLFTLGKSLTYYLNAIDSNGVLIRKLKNYSSKLGFTEDNLELIDDVLIENTQCYRQSEIYSTILGGMMDARASIVNNNLNLLMKKLTFITIGIMLPNLVISAFSMNVSVPFEKSVHAFWIIMALAFFSTIIVFFYERKNK